LGGVADGATAGVAWGKRVAVGLCIICKAYGRAVALHPTLKVMLCQLCATAPAEGLQKTLDRRAKRVIVDPVEKVKREISNKKASIRMREYRREKKEAALGAMVARRGNGVVYRLDDKRVREFFGVR